MTSKERAMCMLTEFVESKREGLDSEAAYLMGMSNGILIGLGDHENVVALIMLFNEVLKSFYRR